jgi:hypothetical protein
MIKVVSYILLDHFLNEKYSELRVKTKETDLIRSRRYYGNRPEGPRVLLRKTLEDHYTTREQPVQGALEECL